SRAQRIVVADPLGASLNPRFSDDGRRLFWSVKEKTGRRVRQSALGRTPGSENPFAGWHLAIADFERPEGGRAEIERRVDLYRGEGGYFEAQAMLGDTILFSHTPGGQRFVESLYRARSDGSDRVALTAVPSTAWNASGMPSPGRSLVTFTSSRSFDWSYARDKRSKLRLELWALTGGGDLVQLTDFNKELPDQSKRVIVADHAWGPSGRDIAVYSSAIGGDGTVRQRITILSLNEAF
ncbi:MAG: hypothetical protein V3U03_09255, partial [Myxococcota bacterium]